MKVTTVFFKSNINRVTNTIGSIYRNIAYLTYICILIIALIFFISHINISNNIISLASNVYITDSSKLNLATLVSANPIFNSTSFIVNKKAKDDVVSVANKNNSDFDILDSIAVNEAIATFSNKRQLTVSSSDTSTLERVSLDTMKILNYSSLRNINYQDLYNKNIVLTDLSDKILLYNTHTSESYANSEKYKFDYTGTYRTIDSNYNMISVAKSFEENLEEKGITVVQDTTPHDYGTYTSAYSRSKVTVKDDITKYGNFGISIDVHRDATADLTYAPKVNINGINVAQCMFVVGVGTESSRNQYYADNLSLAIQIQLLADKIYPGLFRPMIIRNSIYNQDLNRYSLLIEVGATGNTLEEAYYATRCISNLFNIIYKK